MYCVDEEHVNYWDLIYRTFIARGEFVDKIGNEWCIFTITSA